MLTELLQSSVDQSLVLGIDADWGQGKSTFLRMWLQHLENKGFKALYFNAWESDFSDDAFVSLMGELELGMSKLGPQGRATAYLQKAKKAGLRVIRRAIPAAVKLATAGVLNLDEFSEAALAEAAEKWAAEKVKSYEAARQSVAGFREALAAFAQELTKPHDGEARLPLVIVIDELDRCRPPYAIEVLEAVKHFFSVPGVAFVVAADGVQLGNIVRTRYGMDVETGGYLRRFVDITFSLPVPSGTAFLDAQFDKFGLREFFNSRTGQLSQYDYAHFKELFEVLFRSANCSCRDQES